MAQVAARGVTLRIAPRVIKAEAGVAQRQDEIQ